MKKWIWTYFCKLVESFLTLFSIPEKFKLRNGIIPHSYEISSSWAKIVICIRDKSVDIWIWPNIVPVFNENNQNYNVQDQGGDALPQLPPDRDGWDGLLPGAGVVT